MESDVTIGLALLAGAISFISPCVLPLVPAYIGYMGGRMTQRVAAESPGGSQSAAQRFGILAHGLFFVLGFTLFFVLFGLLTTAAVSSLTSLGVTESEVESGIARIGGTAVILFGLHILGVLNRLFTWLLKQAVRLDRSPYANLISAVIAVALIGLIYWLFVESWFLTLVVVLVLLQVFRNALKADSPGEFWGRILITLQSAFYADTRRQTVAQQSRYGYLGSLLMGVVFSAGWTPCIGPIYAAVLAMASSGESLTRAAVLLTAYSLGLGIPFLLTALALDRTQGVLRGVQKHMRVVEVFSGVFLILIGVLVFSGQLQRLSTLGGEGSLGELSANLEDCAVGLVRSEVRLRNGIDCVSDGVKDEFYVAVSRTLPVPPDSAAEPGSLDVPDLGAPVDGANTSQAAPLAEPATDVPEGLQVGQRAPDFSAETPDGQTVSLSDYRGQTVLLNFWATWCGPCRNEMPDFQTLYETRDNFVVLAVNNLEDKNTVGSFVEELGLTFPVALDESGTINSRLYGDRVQGYPTSFLIDANGVIVNYFPGELKPAQLIDALDKLEQN